MSKPWGPAEWRGGGQGRLGSPGNQPRTRNRGAAEGFLNIWLPQKSATPLGDVETGAWRSPSIA